MGNSARCGQGGAVQVIELAVLHSVGNAVTSAGVYISAGAEGAGNLRTAVTPSGNSAISTQMQMHLNMHTCGIRLAYFLPGWPEMPG
jgi:hypothetical protein